MAPACIRLVLAAGWFGLGLAFVHAAEPSRQQRIAALPEDDRVWLTEFVAPIILPEEEKAFLQLTEAREREGFQSDFWQRREKPDLPLPMGPGYRDRYLTLRRLVDEKYDGWQSDAGRLVLRRGEPDSIFKPRCGGDEVFRDLEVWTYGSLELNGHPASRHIFYRPAPGAPRRLWIVHDGNASV
ncbi:MAG: GWxTD domain-containing protein, partial [Thermoanaerobaculia bacterium]